LLDAIPQHRIIRLDVIANPGRLRRKRLVLLPD